MSSTKASGTEQSKLSLDTSLDDILRMRRKDSKTVGNTGKAVSTTKSQHAPSSTTSTDDASNDSSSSKDDKDESPISRRLRKLKEASHLAQGKNTPVRRKQANKNRKPLEKAPKNAHKKSNPMLDLFAKHKDEKPTVSDAYQRLSSKSSFQVPQQRPSSLLNSWLLREAATLTPISTTGAPVATSNGQEEKVLAAIIAEIDPNVVAMYKPAEQTRTADITTISSTISTPASSIGQDEDIMDIDDAQIIVTEQATEFVPSEDLPGFTFRCSTPPEEAADGSELAAEPKLMIAPAPTATSPVDESPVSTFSSASNTAQTPSRLSREDEEEPNPLHVVPAELPVSPKKPSHMEENVAKAEESASDPSDAEEHNNAETVATVSSDTHASDAVGEHLIESSENATTSSEMTVEDTYVIDSILSRPNGDGQTAAVQKQHEDIVAIHIAPFIATAEDTYVACSILSRPNGDGQAAAVRKQHEDIVAMHIAPFIVPRSSKQVKAKKGRKHPTSKFSNTTVPTSEPDHLAVASPPTDAHESKDDTVATEGATEQDTKAEQENKASSQDIDSHNVSSPAFRSHHSLKSTSEEVRSGSHRNPSTSESSKPASAGVPAAKKPLLDEAAERKLYLAHNTFLGFTCLTDFIEKLGIDFSDLSTTKFDICEAFVACRNEEYKEMHGHPSDGISYSISEPLTWRTVKLGQTSLYDFLHMIPFKDENNTDVVEVMEAFEKAAKKVALSSSKLAQVLGALSKSEVEPEAL